ncbi:MAG: Cof-type HAD-IIB family hydrolase [Nocardioides sp.]
MQRLVVTDLDGTLLRSDGSVSGRTREVLDAVDALGVVVVFVTGRPLRWMSGLWEHVGGHGLAVCSNGGIVYDVPGRRITEARTIPRAIGLEVAAEIRAAVPGSVFSVERTTGAACEPDFPDRREPGRPAGGESERGPLEAIFVGDVVKLLALHPELDPADYWHRVDGVVGDRVTTTWSSAGALVEISAAGVTKGSTLARLCHERGIAAADVVAFGDMPNDMAMLTWAGRSYAMGNAHPSVLEIADHVAPTNDEDGVAAVLAEQFGLTRR